MQLRRGCKCHFSNSSEFQKGDYGVALLPDPGFAAVGARPALASCAAQDDVRGIRELDLGYVRLNFLALARWNHMRPVLAAVERAIQKPRVSGGPDLGATRSNCPKYAAFPNGNRYPSLSAIA